jgi:hypothetical protein
MPARSKERNGGTKKERTNKKQTSKEKGLPQGNFRPGTYKNHQFLIFDHSRGDKYKDSGLQYVTP